MVDSNTETEVAHLRARNEKLQGILEASKQLGSELNIDRLLERILGEATAIIECDRCSLFIVDHDRQELWSKIAQGGVDEIRFPVGKGIAGQCAATRKAIVIADAYGDDRFNPDVDKSTGYKTRNMLTVPMLDADSVCTGVIQALNKSDGRDFTEEDEELLMALGGQAAVAVENALLHGDIEKLFEGFIKASVYAIEARDPTTSGHSERVAILTVGVADAFNREAPPSYKTADSFTDDELRELRYAALLHDFGKVGVREHVLVKANKLYPHELEVVESRFAYAQKEMQNRYLQQKVKLLEPKGLHGEVCDHCNKLDEEEARALTELEEFWQFIMTCNRPTVLEEGGFERLKDIAGHKYRAATGEMPLLRENEVINLSIPRGSLNQDERSEIESHVTYTYKFLEQIPWTRDLKRVPEIAYKHHEKLNAKGYPQSSEADAIPVQTRMMTISDIYDALTASDRPYKKAMPHGRALDILMMDAKKGALDMSLLELFIEARVHEKLPSVPKD